MASIAWNQLDECTRFEVSKLLRAHPDYERWLSRVKDPYPEKGIFIETSTWPDEIRQDKRFYTAGVDEPTPVLPGFSDTERHSDWHYINRPLSITRGNRPVLGQIDKQLVTLAKTLGTPVTSITDRVYALPWLIHLVGDAHQPLHTSVWVNAKGKWSKFEDELTVINPFNPRKKSSTLHVFWDDLPGYPAMRGEHLEMTRRALVAAYPRPPHSISSDQWIEESWQLARENGYPVNEDMTSIIIDQSFFDNSREIANHRITQAGYRLADLLNHLFSRSP